MGWGSEGALLQPLGVYGFLVSRSTLRELRRIMMKTGVQLAFVGGSMLSSMRDREGWTGQTWGCAPTSLEMCIWGCFSVGGIVLTVKQGRSR